MKIMRMLTYIIGIEIFRDRSQGLLELSQKTYINKVLKRFRIKKVFIKCRFNLKKR